MEWQSEEWSPTKTEKQHEVHFMKPNIFSSKTASDALVPSAEAPASIQAL